MLQVLAIISEKQREVNLSLTHVYRSLLGKALQQDGGTLLDLLLQRVHWEPGSVTFDGLNLVHPGTINEVAAHLPKLLEVGLLPDCRVGGPGVAAWWRIWSVQNFAGLHLALHMDTSPRTSSRWRVAGWHPWCAAPTCHSSG